MIRINCPATSANLGPGFDCLGIAFDIYNSFEVELADDDILENCQKEFNNANNLFIDAFHQAMDIIGKEAYIHVKFDCNIPIARGMGSSSTLILGGICAASYLHGNALSDDEIFDLACRIEGHGDNIAPCFYGGLTSTLYDNDTYYTHLMKLNDSWHYTLLTPDILVSTEEARSILPHSYSLKDVSSNLARLTYMCEGLANGSISLIKLGHEDKIHEPYRRQLIDEFDKLKEICESDNQGILLISGSGSTCLYISKNDLSREQEIQIKQLQHHWMINRVNISKGLYIDE